MARPSPRVNEKTVRKVERQKPKRAWTLAQGRDIAERSRIWQALLESEDRYRATFDCAPVGIMHTSVDSDRILHANPKLSEMLGYTENELLGMTTDDILHPDHAGADRPRYREKMLSGELDSFSSQRKYIRKDSSVIWVNRMVYLARDPLGKPLYFIRIVEDITGRKQAEANLKRLARARHVMAECSRVLVHASDETAMLQEMCRVAVGSGGYKMAWVGLATGDPARPVYPAAHAGFEGDAPMTASAAWSADGRYQGFMHEVIATGNPHIARDILRDPALAHRRARAVQHGFQSSIALPLEGRGAILGAIAIYAREADAFDEEEIALLTELASDIAYGIVNLRTRIAREQAEERSRETERRFRETFEQAAVGLTRVDLNGVLVDFNQKFCDMLGYSREELLGKAIKDITHPDDYGQGSQFRAHLVNGVAKSQAGEKRFMRKDGTVLWAQRTMSMACDAAGRPQYVISVVEDITERKEAEAERARLAMIVENAGDAIIGRALDGTITSWNAAAERMFGYSESEMIGQSIAILVPEQHRHLTDNNERLRRGEMIPVSERIRVTKDGRIIHVQSGISPIKNEAGEVIGAAVIVRDITERKRAEESVVRERALLRTIIDTVPDYIYVKDAEGRFSLANKAWLKERNLSDETIAGKTVFDVFPAELAERMADQDVGVMRTGVPILDFEQRVIVKRPEGGRSQPRWFSITKVPMVDASDKIIGTVGTSRDITERKLSAQRREMEHAIASALAEATTVGEALPKVIQTICEGLDWDCGFHWSWNKPSELLRCREHWYRHADAMDDFVQASLGMVNEAPAVVSTTPSGGLVRRVWASATPVWLPDVASMPDFRRAPAAMRADLHGTFAFPIMMEGRPWGVMEFFSHEIREPGEALLQIVRAIGSQIGQFIRRKETEQALRESEEQFRQLAGNIPQVFWITDTAQRQTLYVSSAAEAMLGRPLQDILSDRRALIRAVHKEDRARVYAARKAAVEGGYDETYRILRSDGSIRWVHERAFPVRDGEGRIYRIAGIAEDVTDRKHAEERLEHLAHYDVLTNLPNRALFYDRLKQALVQAKRNRWTAGVMFIDADRFKNVNDTLGHAVGDKLLQQIAGRLTRSVRSGDTVGRLGGDEFAIVLSTLASAQDANLVAQKIMTAFDEPFKLEGTEVYVTASIGITLYPDDSSDQDILIKNADAAMYRAKEIGRNGYQFYMPEMNARAVELLGMESSLRRALERNEFLVYYQPKASVADGDITGLEALLRWKHPERGLVLPVEFIPLLEESGLIVQVGEWVLKAVCAQIKAWERAGDRPVPVAVNLSARQFAAKDLGPTIKRILEEHQMDPALIELEITESALMANTEEAVRTLEYLDQLGVGLSIDDFGTGYSSLGYLKRFPLSALKIDSSFVRDVTSDGDDATITRAVISMAHSLGLKVIAEGVETRAQLEFLAEYGCNEIQGYYFAHPLAAEDCSTWVREQRRLERPRPASDVSMPVVLLLDDDDDTLAHVKRILARDGYRILAAHNAREGLALLRDQHVDVVVSDQDMPGMSGVDFLQCVQTLSPKTMRILATSYADFQTMADAVNKGGIFRCLPKDIDDDALRASVREAMQAKIRALENSIPPGTLGK